MKVFSFKIIVALIAFSLGIASVWAIGGFSYLASLFEQTPSIFGTSAQFSETLPTPNPIEIKKSFVVKHTPRFKDYTVGEIYKSKTTQLKLTEIDEEDRVRLQWAVDNQEVDFAGHYILTNWSCGMWCSRVAVIDAKTGKIYGSPVSPEVCFPHLDNEFVCNENFENIKYKIDSKLIVFFGFRFDNNPDGEKGFHYYKFDDGRFIHLKSVLVKEQRRSWQIKLDEFDEKDK